MRADDKVAESLPTSAGSFVGRLRLSWQLHVRKPWLFGVALTVGVISVMVGSVGTANHPSPQGLARAFAMPPLDLFRGLHLLDNAGRLWWAPVLSVVHVGALGLFSRAVGGAFRVRHLIVIYVGGYGLHVLLAGLGVAFVLGVTWRSPPLVFLVMALVPVFHLGAAGIGSAMVAKSFFGISIRDHLRSLHFWLLVGVSTWLWMLFSLRLQAVEGTVMGFTIAGVVLVVQGILLVAAVLPGRTNRPSAE